MMQTYIGSYWYHFSEQVPICKVLLIYQYGNSVANLCNSAQANFITGQDAKYFTDYHDEINYMATMLLKLTLSYLTSLLGK